MVGGAIRNRIRRIRSLRDEAGKFSKAEAYYVDDAYLKPFRCGNCEYYDGVNNTCDLVSEEGTPGPGRISRDGSCSLFNARPPRIQFIQHFWGRAKREGIAPERVRATGFLFTYTSLDEEPPQEIQEKALVDVETIERFNPL